MRFDPREKSEVKRARAAILALTDTLEEKGVAYVLCYFEGGRGEGGIEFINFYSAEADRADLEGARDAGQEPGLGLLDADIDQSMLIGHLDAIAPPDYDADAGGFGMILFDVERQTIHVNFTARIVSYERADYQVDDD